MFVAVDDTDSVRGNCTTFLATEIIKELSDLDLIGCPRLVRLNPAVPWKTRGNGSLVMKFGHGVGKRKFIGMIDGRELYCYDDLDSYEPDYENIMKRLAPLTEKYCEYDANAGLLISSQRSDLSFYKRGVTTILSREEINDEISRIGALTFTTGNGRGLIGATCGLAWVPGDVTFELLAYRERNKWGTKRQYDLDSIKRMDFEFPTTFNNWEDRRRKAAIVPSTPCPVLYGLRGDVLKDVIDAANVIETEKKYRWVVFLTNQGTDDHIIMGARELVPNQSYLIRGKVISKAGHIEGGHVFINIDTKYGMITCGAYEPSKEFRFAFDQLVSGDEIEVMGELRDSPRTLNVEKLHVIATVRYVEKVSNPICHSCGKRMNSVGKGQGYRCKICHTRERNAVIRYRNRWIVPGWYEPPVCSRRHLSKPLKRMGLEQPVEFIKV
ncbi:MAG: tRNA(Ile)(2)-agmatinylcytidine synthase [archaeon]|nr:tRNA(Ile)(2)-agmatinylcytidine synthase [archaeon]